MLSASSIWGLILGMVPIPGIGIPIGENCSKPNRIESVPGGLLDTLFRGAEMKFTIVVGSLAFAATAAADSFGERWNGGNLPAVAFDPTSFYLQAAYDEPIEGSTSVWFKIVAALNRDSARLDGQDRRFVSYMFNKLTSDPAYVPTALQAKWILHICARLGRDLP
jgi:hypothetical protein